MKDSFTELTDFAIQVMLGNEKTAAILSYVVKDAPDAKQAEDFVKCVASMVVMPKEMRDAFVKEEDDNDITACANVADMICEELHIWEYSPANN